MRKKKKLREEREYGKIGKKTPKKNKDREDENTYVSVEENKLDGDDFINDKQISIRKRTKPIGIENRNVKQARMMEEVIEMRKKKTELVYGLVKRKSIKIRKRSKGNTESEKKKKNDENHGINGRKKTSDEKERKKSRYSGMNKQVEDEWLERKKKKRSRTKAEDIRRYFRTEDKH